mmetsp:Transcript_18184/g.28530  ORF Transcript_18184/g.28530 Transcript_18184/m.28530 type:complete len:253 (+) Transcript_18184:508-1266(+)
MFERAARGHPSPYDDEFLCHVLLRGNGFGGFWLWFGAVLVFFKEIEHILAIAIIVSVLEKGFARAWARQVYVDDLANGRLWAVGHHDYAICQQNGFIYIMRDTDRGHFGAVPDFHENLLQLPASKAVEHAKRFIQKQKFRRQSKGAGDAHTLFHAVGHRVRRAVHGVGKANTLQVVLHHVLALALAGFRVDLVHANGHVFFGRQPWEEVGRLKHNGALWIRAFHVATIKTDATFGNWVKTCRHGQNRGFTTA